MLEKVQLIDKLEVEKSLKAPSMNLVQQLDPEELYSDSITKKLAKSPAIKTKSRQFAMSR